MVQKSLRSAGFFICCIKEPVIDNMVRAFLAIKPPLTIIRVASRTVSQLAQVDGAPVKWVQPELLHLTLKFFGTIEVAATPAICAEVRSVVQDVAAFPIQIQGVGAFPSVTRPRTIWAGVGVGGAQVNALAQSIDAALATLGYARDKRAFSAHLTLGRVKGRGSIAPLAQALVAQADRSFGSMTVDSVLLFSSKLGRSGPRYQCLATMSLAKSVTGNRIL